MRVRLAQLMAGPGGVFNAGSVVELPDEDAADLVSRGGATAVDPEPKAAAPAGEGGEETPPAGRRRRG